MSPEIISLLVQVPLVGAFVYFTVILLKSFNANQKDLAQATQQHESELQDSMLRYLEEQQTQWRELIGMERDRLKEAMDQGLRQVEVLVASIDKLAETISKQAERIERHDAAAKERHAELVRRIEQ